MAPTAVVGGKRQRAQQTHRRQSAKRAKTTGSTNSTRNSTPQPVAKDVALVLDAVHQFGLVGGDHYDDKPTHFRNLVDRLTGNVLVLAPERSMLEAQKTLEGALPDSFVPDEASCSSSAADITARIRRVASPARLSGASLARTRSSSSTSSPTKKAPPPAPSAAWFGGSGINVTLRTLESVPADAASSQGYDYLVHYDLPKTAAEYVRHMSSRLQATGCLHVYTLVDHEEVGGRACSSIAALMRRAWKAARKADAGKATEMLVTLRCLGEEMEDDDGEEEEEECDEEEEEEETEYDEDADEENRFRCSVSYHASGHGKASRKKPPCVEVVRIPLPCIKNLESLSHIVNPRLPHVCTVICCHNLNCVDPWDGWEHLFALPDGVGVVRVIFVLADGGSFHDYPDMGAYDSGCSWIDFIDPETMLETDALIEKLIQFETKLLQGDSRRVVLFGKSQGGVQNLHRFIKSSVPLGGYVGGMCHVPTVPHLPRSVDPVAEVAASGSPAANAATPVRLLIGDRDSTFAPAMVVRSAERLRTVGGFSDVEVEVMPRLDHEDVLDDEGNWIDPDADPAEMAFLKKHIVQMLKLPANVGAAVNGASQSSNAN
eukprot:TRINITY_DN12282_c0_g1_i1.p1 TRINITY_DN12282_c0_g1~~TRINITY_DN12282_c0_g1_i1.p1  ORF type:complete len:602 (+),score=140.34 TRINITY_DN12282_c0_g1_i1:96-1901(+)